MRIQRSARTALILWVTVLSGTLACVNWTPQQNVLACKGLMNLAVRPECARLDKLDVRYTQLCESAVDLARASCDLIDRSGPTDYSVLCDPIGVLVGQCATVIPGDDPANVETCQRVLGLLELACQIQYQTPPESVPEVAEGPTSL